MSMLEMRSKRFFDELDAAAPSALLDTLPARNSQVLGNSFLSRPVRRMFQPWHVSEQRFLITPGWFEFVEGTFGGVRLRDMSPKFFPVGTHLYLECTMKWKVDGGKKNNTDRTYKTGGFTCKTAEVVSFGPDEELPALSEGPPDDSADPQVMDQDWIRRFTLGTIGRGTVSASQRGYAFPMSGTGAFDIALMSL